MARHRPLQYAAHMWIHPLIAAVAITTALASSSALAQDSVATPDTARVDLRPRLRGASKKELFFGGTAAGTAVAFEGSLTATMVFWAVCPSRHRDDPPSNYFLGLGPCTFPSTETVAGTWLAGSFIGASGGAAIVARWRGCRTRDAVLRSMVGAAFGSVPGFLAFSTSRGPDRYPATRSMWITLTPVLAGVGSSLAVINCQRS